VGTPLFFQGAALVRASVHASGRHSCADLAVLDKIGAGSVSLTIRSFMIEYGIHLVPLKVLPSFQS
jgi:hypothetical protein